MDREHFYVTKDDIINLGRSHALIHAVVRVHERGDLSWEMALHLLVQELVKENNQLKWRLMKFHETHVPPILITGDMSCLNKTKKPTGFWVSGLQWFKTKTTAVFRSFWAK